VTQGTGYTGNRAVLDWGLRGGHGVVTGENGNLPFHQANTSARIYRSYGGASTTGKDPGGAEGANQMDRKTYTTGRRITAASITAPRVNQCPDHKAYDRDNCPVCGTARVIGGTVTR
jgi:hypothetical protein